MSGTESISVTLTLPEWQVILAGLYELPLKHSGALAAKLQQQIAEATRPRPLKEEAAA